MRSLVKGVVLFITVIGALSFGADHAGANTMPLPTNANASNPEVSINDTGCNASGVCFAIGSYIDTSGQTQALIETLRGGSWAASEAALPAGYSTSDAAAMLNSVSCDGNDCMAVGNYLDASGDSQGLIESYSGTLGVWTAARASLSGVSGAGANPWVVLTGVNCPSGVNCVAVGYYNTDGPSTNHGLIGFDTNGSWAFTTAPTPTGAASATLGAIDCPTDTTCDAVGAYTDANGAQQPLFVSGWGSSWTSVTATLPSNSAGGSFRDGTLTAISCANASACAASGQYQAQNGNTLYDQAMVATGAATSWSLQSAPMPANADSTGLSVLFDVSCASSLACVAVGSYVDKSGDSEGLIDSDASGTWSASEAPLPAGGAAAGSQYAALESVDCPNTSWCALVGGYLDSAGHGQGLVETGTGSTWSSTLAQLPSSSQTGDLASVYCQASKNCFAGGVYQDAAGRAVPAVVGAPSAPATPSVASAGNSVTASLSLTDDGGLPVTFYTATAIDLTSAARGGEVQNPIGSQKSTTFTGLTPGDTYAIRVVASNVFGTSPPVTSPRIRVLTRKLIYATERPLLKPAGGSARIKSLRKSHGYTFIYDALQAGQIRIDWYHVSGHGKHTHRALIATGVAHTSAGAKVSVHVTLNGAGRRLLAQASTLGLSATVTFTPAGSSPIGLSGSFTLH